MNKIWKEEPPVRIRPLAEHWSGQNDVSIETTGEGISLTVLSKLTTIRKSEGVASASCKFKRTIRFHFSSHLDTVSCGCAIMGSLPVDIINDKLHASLWGHHHGVWAFLVVRHVCE